MEPTEPEPSPESSKVKVSLPSPPVSLLTAIKLTKPLAVVLFSILPSLSALIVQATASSSLLLNVRLVLPLPVYCSMPVFELTIKLTALVTPATLNMSVTFIASPACIETWLIRLAFEKLNVSALVELPIRVSMSLKVIFNNDWLFVSKVQVKSLASADASRVSLGVFELLSFIGAPPFKVILLVGTAMITKRSSSPRPLSWVNTELAPISKVSLPSEPLPISMLDTVKLVSVKLDGVGAPSVTRVCILPAPVFHSVVRFVVLT